MTKHILLLAAVVGLGVSSVYAEDPPPDQPTSNPVYKNKDKDHHSKKHQSPKPSPSSAA